MTWETSFVAMSAALGVDTDEAAGAIAGDAKAPEMVALVAAMKSTKKALRAHALASALEPIARELAAAELGGAP